MIKYKGIFTLTVNGVEHHFQNTFVESATDLFDVVFRGTTQSTEFFLGIVNGSSTLDIEDTMASHPGWEEFEGTGLDCRIKWEPNPAEQSGSDVVINNFDNEQVFIVERNFDFGGAFLTNSETLGGTTGKLISIVTLVTPITIQVGDELTLKYQVRLDPQNRDPNPFPVGGLTVEGCEYILDVYFNGLTKESYFVGLIDRDTGFVALDPDDTLASHDWVELPNTRESVTWTAAPSFLRDILVNGSDDDDGTTFIVSDDVVFNMSANINVLGVFVCTVGSGTNGVLIYTHGQVGKFGFETEEFVDGALTFNLRMDLENDV